MSTDAERIDAGTNARICTPAPAADAAHKSARADASRSRTSLRAMVVAKARTLALQMLRSRHDDMRAWSGETAQCFVAWFGTDSLSARARITQRIERAIAKLNALRPGDFIDDPGETDFAYVNPRIVERGAYERTVHLGSAFWHADDKTRAGTLIHECSHFQTVGGTDDVGSEAKDRAATSFPGKSRGKYSNSAAMYGATRATRLAISHPSLALNNADSFEFFIEGREPSLIRDEFGRPDFEGVGDFPARGTTVL